jgi:hypothetical protein
VTASDGKALPPSPANHHYTRRELLQTGMIGIVGGMRSPARARALIDLVLSLGGTYYLPYHLHATR